MSIESTTAISVYSESLSERDYLRNQINTCGFTAICFEVENTCIDNLKTMQPKIVIVHTDSATCVWRFIFALHLAGLRTSLIVLSEHMNVERFQSVDHSIPLHSLPNHHDREQFSKKIMELAAKQLKDGAGVIRHLFVGESDEARHIRSRLPQIAQSHDSVLIVGERRVGKEILARFIVENSNSNKHLVKIDCGVLEPRALFDGEMRNILRPDNRFKPTTVLLDKIHLISLELQADLLLLVEEAHNLGGERGSEAKYGVRFIATSEHSIESLLCKGLFRKDLYYRLNVIPLFLSPLRHRKADISSLMDYFIIDICVKNDKGIVIPSNEAREILYMYDWPSNADELRNYMHRVSNEGNESYILSHLKIHNNVKNVDEQLLKAASAEELPKEFEIKDFIPTAKSLSLKSICDEFVSRTERRLMKRALESTNWNRKKAAELLNISYKSMLNKIKTYDII